MAACGPALDRLQLDGCGLTALPAALEPLLPQLATFDVSNNKLQAATAAIARLLGCRLLDAFNCFVSPDGETGTYMAPPAVSQRSTAWRHWVCYRPRPASSEPPFLDKM